MKKIIVILALIALYILVGHETPTEQTYAPIDSYPPYPAATLTRTVATSPEPDIVSAALYVSAALPSPTVVSSPLPEISYAPTPEPVCPYTKAEMKLIARVVYGESRGESFEGKVAVAEVVLNRVESGRFGKSVKRVVNARHQFAVSSKYNESCMEAVEYAIENRTLPKNTYYFQRANRKYWGKSRSIKRYCTIGAHTFYTLGGAEIGGDIDE